MRKSQKNKNEHIPSSILLVVGWSWKTNKNNKSQISWEFNGTSPQCHPSENRAYIRPAISCWFSWHLIYIPMKIAKKKHLEKIRSFEGIKVLSGQSNKKPPKFSSAISWTDSLEYLPGTKRLKVCIYFDVLLIESLQARKLTNMFTSQVHKQPPGWINLAILTHELLLDCQCSQFWIAQTPEHTFQPLGWNHGCKKLVKTMAGCRERGVPKSQWILDAVINHVEWRFCTFSGGFLEVFMFQTFLWGEKLLDEVSGCFTNVYCISKIHEQIQIR